MEKKMSVMGVGAKIAMPVLLWVLASEGVSWFMRPRFTITSDYRALIPAGLILIILGFSLNLAAAFTMIKAHRENRLATNGLYAIFSDPMYVLQTFLTMPGLFLLFNSYLVLLGVVPTYLCYRAFVSEEHRYLQRRFGEEYRRYMERVPIKL